MNPRSSRILTAIFCGWLALFWLCYLIPDGVPKVIGYRNVMAFPDPVEGWWTSSWLQKLSAWAIDHSPFHYKTIVLRNRTLLKLAPRLRPLPLNPGNSQVSMGRSGFLFYLDDALGYRHPKALREMADTNASKPRPIARKVCRSARRSMPTGK